MVTGTLKNGSSTTPMTNGKLRGDQITFTAGGVHVHRPRQRQHDRGTTSTEQAWRATRS